MTALPPLQPGTPEQNALWDHVYEYGHAAEGVHGLLEKVCQAYALAAIAKDRERQSVPAFDSVRLTRFLTDVVTAAGLLSHGKQSKAVAERVAKEACAIRSMLAAAPQPQPVQQPVVWLPIETAPKDSSMLRLLVNFDDHSLEDCSEPCWTIGTNALSDTGVDEWLFAGWDWTHDRFTQGTGTPIGWLPMLYTPPQAAQPLTPEWYARWIRNNYQDHPNIATLCEELTKAAHGITKGTT